MRQGRHDGQNELKVASPWPSRDPVDPSVLVLDGYGISVTVSRGHLHLEDGLGRHRRERRLPRAQRTVRRIVVLGHTGHISLEAIRWCHDTGVALLQLEPDGTVLLTSSPTGRDDARLRRSQAAAATNPHGMVIAKALLGAKLEGQATVLRRHGVSDTAATEVEALADQLAAAPDVVECRDLEAKAANIYFGAWSANVTSTFAERERRTVPDHWTVFAARGSLLNRGGRSARNAADPINALLNYGYALLEAEARLAANALGLDPGLGVIHTDKRNRDSLALDIIEPVRPLLDDLVLELLRVRRFRADDFIESPQGGCRLRTPLATELLEHLPRFAREIAVHAEAVAHVLAEASPGQIEMRTPLTRDKNRRAQTLGRLAEHRQPPTTPRVVPTCRVCGGDVTDAKRQLCTSCWTVTRRQLAAERAAHGNNALAAMRARGEDPTNTPQAAAKRAQALSTRKREELTWTPNELEATWTSQWYSETVAPGLGAVALSAIAGATGLSISACSRIRSGQLTPHRRHWSALHALAHDA